MTTLYPFQDDVIAKLDAALVAGKRRLILVAPTGSGKTEIASALIKRVAQQCKRVLVLAHRREIIHQTGNKLRRHGVVHGTIQAGVQPRPFEDVQVASVQTLWLRAMRAECMKLPAAKLLVIDEAHHCPARSYKKIIDAFPDAILIGLTATPCRGDGRGLGSIFEEIIEAPQVAELIAGGYLVKTRVYAPVDPDLRGVRTVGGDYVESQLAERMDRPQLVGDVVSHWYKYSERRRTVAFAVNVAHSVHLCDEFIKSGVRAEHIDGTTPKPERDLILAKLASGEIELVTNCMVLTEGWDLPEVGCCILARPTKKMGLYRQMIGRVLRVAPGKTDAIILDHSGAVFRHGFAEDRVEWTLDPDKRATSRAHQSRLKYRGSRLLECTQCSAIRMAGQPCPHCGFMPKRPPRAVPIADGELGLVDRHGRVKNDLLDPALRQRWHAMLTDIANSRGYKRGWVAHTYKEKFGAWPPRGDVTPEEATPEVLAWVRSRFIAFAKSRRAA
jgi:DNA repair protein RadD